MNIAFFLTPKAEVAWVPADASVRQALERMEHFGYTAIPVLTPEGGYQSTLTEGDLLWFLKRRSNVTFGDTERMALATVPRRLDVRPIAINAEIEQLLDLALDQSFVPVVDDRAAFIGIVRRRSILAHFQSKMARSLTRRARRLDHQDGRGP